MLGSLLFQTLLDPAELGNGFFCMRSGKDVSLGYMGNDHLHIIAEPFLCMWHTLRVILCPPPVHCMLIIVRTSNSPNGGVPRVSCMHPLAAPCSPLFGLPCGGTLTLCSPFRGGASTTCSPSCSVISSQAILCHFMAASSPTMPHVPTPRVLWQQLFQPQLAGLMLAVPSAAGVVPTTGSTPHHNIVHACQLGLNCKGLTFSITPVAHRNHRPHLVFNGRRYKSVPCPVDTTQVACLMPDTPDTPLNSALGPLILNIVVSNSLEEPILLVFI